MGFTKYASLACAGLAALAVTGCSSDLPTASASVAASSGTGTTADQEAYFVMGVKPNNMMLEIEQAELQGNTIKRFVHVFPLHNYGQVEGGYIVGKARVGTPLAVRTMSAMAGHTMFGLLYYPCHETISFQLTPGKVTYVTDLSYSKEGEIKQDVKDDFNAAKDYVELHYPALAKDLQAGQYQIVQYPKNDARISDHNRCTRQSPGR